MPDELFDPVALSLVHSSEPFEGSRNEIADAGEAAALLDSVSDPGQVADLVVSNLDIESSEKQDVLESTEVLERLRKVLTLLTRQLEILKVRERLNNLIANETGQDVEKVTKDSDRNFWMNAEEACEYGLVSKVIKSATELP